MKPTIVGRSAVIFRSSSSHILSSIGFIGLDQYGLDLGERPDRHGQTFSVTDDLEVFGHRRADQIAQILQVERAEEFGAFRRPEGSEQIAQVSDRLESSRLRQKLARADQLGEPGSRPRRKSTTASIVAV